MSHLLTSEPGWGGCTLLSQKIDLEVFANQVVQTAVAGNRHQGFILKDFANQVLQTEGRCHCTKILSSDGFYLTFTVVEIISLIVRLFC